MTHTAPRHGTHAAYQHCLHRPEGACNPCAQAAARYQQAWRVRNGRSTSLKVDVALLATLLAAAPHPIRRLAADSLGDEVVRALLEVGREPT